MINRSRDSKFPTFRCKTVWLQAIAPGDPEKAREQPDRSVFIAPEIRDSVRWR
jgi:hypothetical protein